MTQNCYACGMPRASVLGSLCDECEVKAILGVYEIPASDHRVMRDNILLAKEKAAMHKETVRVYQTNKEQPHGYWVRFDPEQLYTLNGCSLRLIYTAHP